MPLHQLEKSDCTPTLKSAWIDEKRRILYFLPTPGAEEYRAAEGPFWEYVLLLMRQGYRVG